MLGAVALLVAIASWIQPINSFFYRTTFLVGLAGTVVALFVLLEKNYLRLLLLLAVVFVTYGFLKAEPSSMDRSVFDGIWVETTAGYKGSPYRFGGESLLGMDSGGLLRRSLVISQLKLVLATGNPFYLKSAYKIWSEPFSLASLLHPSNTWAELVGYYAPGRSVDLRAGDILVSRSRTEMVVYLGDGEVIGLSPSTKRVAIHPLGFTDLAVFHSWAFVLRWKPWSFDSDLLPP